MTSEVSIRPATIADALAMNAIQLVSFRQIYAGIIPEETFADFPPFTTLQGWQKLLQDPDETDQLLVAERTDGTVIGYTRAGENIAEDDLSYPGEIIALNVLDFHVHAAVAQALLETVLARLVTKELFPAVATTPATAPLSALFAQIGGQIIKREDLWVQGTSHEQLRYGFGGEGTQLA